MNKTDTVRKEKINILIGEISGLFMKQECRGVDIIMPSEDLDRISEDLWSWIQEQQRKAQIEALEDVYVRDYPTETSIKLIEKLNTLKNE